MTREEWRDSINTIGEFIDFCSDEGIWEDVVAELFDEDGYDDAVQEDISEYYYGWRDLRDSLNNLPTGYDWYRRDGMFDYIGIDNDDVDYYLDDLERYLDDIGWFTDEDHEDDDTGHAANTPATAEVHMPWDFETETTEPELEQLNVDGICELVTLAS